MQIRPAHPEDDDAIWAMLRPVIEAGDTYTFPQDISRDEAVSYWRAPSHAPHIAEIDGVAVGTYWLRPNQPGGGDHVCNCAYVTAPGSEGRGIGRAMLAHSLDLARTRGFRAMQYNFVVATNTRAIETWTRAGFVTVGRLPGAFRHPTEGYVDALVMYKDLTDG